MNKKYSVRLTDEERDELLAVIKEAEGDEPEGSACPDPAEGRCRRPELDRPSDRGGVRMPDEDGREHPPAPRGAGLSRGAGPQRAAGAAGREAAQWRARSPDHRHAPRDTSPGYANSALRLLAPRSLLSGEQEARIIAMRLGTPPPGYANWGDDCWRKVVELGIVDSVSHETVRRTLKKTRAANLAGGTFAPMARGRRRDHGGNAAASAATRAAPLRIPVQLPANPRHSPAAVPALPPASAASPAPR